MSTAMKVLGVALVILFVATAVSAIEQPDCPKNIRPWNWGPMPDKSNQSGVLVSSVHVQNGNVLMMPDIAGLKELQARFG